MSLFEKQVNQYTDKFNQLYAMLGKKDVKALYNKCGISNVEEELKGNTKAFKEATLKIAITLMPGIPSCTIYAAIVASLCESLGISFVVKAGTCIKTSLPSYEKDKAHIAAKKAEGIEHPLMATHVYLEVADIIYEYYAGDFSGIDHIDCVEIARY